MEHKLLLFVSLLILQILDWESILFPRKLGAALHRVVEPASNRKECAIVLFGMPGFADGNEKLDHYFSGIQKDIKVPIMTHPTLVEHVVKFNERKWRTDLFFHTWTTDFDNELFSLYRPLSFATGNTMLHDRFAYSGFGSGMKGVMLAAMEIALRVMWDFVAQKRGGRAYDRILLIRFDSLFLRPFNLSKLERSDTLYFAHWCKSIGPQNASMSPNRDCRALSPGRFSSWGAPDFYFAGSDPVMQKIFTRLAYDVNDGILKSSMGMNHGEFLDRAKALDIPVGHYLFHQLDVNLYRLHACGGAHMNCGDLWLERGSDDPSYGYEVDCGVRSYCSCSDERVFKDEGCDTVIFSHPPPIISLLLPLHALLFPQRNRPPDKYDRPCAVNEYFS